MHVKSKMLKFLLLTISSSVLLAASELENKYVLITGGAGYIGSHACIAFQQAGYVPVTYDNLSTGNSKNVQWGPLEFGDVLNVQELESVFEKYKPIGVCHFAAKLDVGESVTNPVAYYRTNVQGSLNVIDAALKYNVKGVVFSSSCSVYGNCGGDTPVDETLPKDPQSPYAQTKLDVENMLRWCTNRTSLNYVCLRYFNVAGADSLGRTGFNLNSHALIPSLFKSSNSAESFKILGDDYATRDGTCVRDYVHVTDLVDAHVKALQYILEKSISNTFCLGSESGFTVKEVLNAASVVVGHPISTVIAPRRVGDLVAIYADSTKAKECLDWHPTNSTLDKIMTHSYQWVKTSMLQAHSK